MEYPLRRVEPVPRFTYRQVLYDGKELGLIEIPQEQPGIAIPRNDLEGLRKGAVYVRRNSVNTEADSAELERIYSKGQMEPIPPPQTLSDTWPQSIVPVSFDTHRIYIAVLDQDQTADTRDWAALAGIPWSIIVDFDTGTDEGGSLATAESVFRNRHALQVTALDDSIKMTARLLFG